MMIAKYRKKPVVVAGMQFKRGGRITDVVDFVGFSNVHVDNDGVIYIKTLEGDMRVDINDWIIKGVKGEFYPCKPDIFEATYDEVECLHNNVDRWNHGYHSMCRDCGEKDV